jgi:hypothetical protein
MAVTGVTIFARAGVCDCAFLACCTSVEVGSGGESREFTAKGCVTSVPRLIAICPNVPATLPGREFVRVPGSTLGAKIASV